MAVSRDAFFVSIIVVHVPFAENRCTHYVFPPLVFVDFFLSQTCQVGDLYVLEKMGGGTLCQRVNTANTNVQG